MRRAILLCGCACALVALPACPLEQPLPPSSLPAPSASASGAKASFRCDEPLMAAGGRRYCLHSEARTFDDAAAVCADYGGRLVALEDSVEEQALETRLGMVGRAQRNVWLGLSDLEAEGTWRTLSSPALTYQHWHPHEPNDAGGSEDCGEWLGFAGTWNDADCNILQSYLCEAVGRPLVCNDVLLPTKRSLCLHVALATWYEAKAACEGHGGQLGTPADAQEERALFRAAAVPNLWLGLDDRDQEGEFRWSTGAPAEYRNWNGGEPNNTGDEDCVELYSGAGTWNDTPCAGLRPFLCEEP